MTAPLPLNLSGSGALTAHDTPARLVLRAAQASITAPPVDPDAPTARDWLRRELAKLPYQQAKPSLLQQLQDWLDNWLNSLSAPAFGAGPPLWILLFVLLVVALVAVGFVLYGRPRRNRRVRAEAGVFGAGDERGAAELRRAARDAASTGDWPLAVVEQFRAIVRDLDNRAVLALAPGTTAHHAAASAGAAFPEEQPALRRAAADFDAVRYLGDAGSAEQWDRMRALDERIRAARPRLDAVQELEGFVTVGGQR